MAAASHRRDGASSPVTWRPASEQCPLCYGNDSLTPVEIDGDVLLYTCNTCGYSCGIDDSTDDQLFPAMMVAECLDADGRPQSDVPFSSSVKVKVVECDKCGNEENDLFRVGDYDEATGCLLLECLACDNQITMTLDGFDGWTESGRTSKFGRRIRQKLR
jgi:Zn ribbon nucleic-acid-binding protein